MRGTATPIDHGGKKRHSMGSEAELGEEAPPEYDNFGALVQK